VKGLVTLAREREREPGESLGKLGDFGDFGRERERERVPGESLESIGKS